MYLLWSVWVLGVLHGALSDVWVHSCVCVWVLFVYIWNGGCGCCVYTWELGVFFHSPLCAVHTNVFIFGCFVCVHNEACGCCVHMWWACGPAVWCPVWGLLCGVGTQVCACLGM